MGIQVTFANKERQFKRTYVKYELPNSNEFCKNPEGATIQQLLAYVSKKLPNDEYLNAYIDHYVEITYGKKFRAIKYITEYILENLEIGKTTTATAVFENIPREGEDITYPRIWQVLEDLVYSGELELKMDKPIGYANYTKCYTRIR